MPACHWYTYTSQLLELDSCKPLVPANLSAALKHIQTPAIAAVWEEALTGHPDQQFVRYILQGWDHGFRIGFQHSSSRLQQAGSNMPIKNPEVVSDYIAKELSAGRLVELSAEEAASLNIHCSPIGIIPKKNKPGRWRLIVDLSSPEDASVNDGIEKEICSLSYTSVDAVADKVLALGRGAMLAKMDIKQAYRMVPIHPQDRHLLGMRWEGKVYVDKTLPFGLRSAPIIFSALADALAWMMLRKGVSFVDHYIDDFITAGRPRSMECHNNLQTMLETCDSTGTPVEPDKTEGPSTVLVFLGIEIDTTAMQLRLPADKLARLKELLWKWRGKKECKKRDLKSLIGVLSHACKVVKPGRTFLRRLIDLSKIVTKPSHFVRLNREARSDIEWWFRFADRWNGVSIMCLSNSRNCNITVTSDASGWWGCGAFHKDKWFQLRWPDAIQETQITVKELVPIVLAAAVWGTSWMGRNVMSYCDNAAVVAILNKGDCKEPQAMHLMRCLAFLKAKFQFSLYASHISGVNNDLADALSRDNLQYFLSNRPQAQLSPTPLPPELLDLTIIKKPDWTSPVWTNLWRAIFGQD